jgi:hypothetical protein
MPGYRDHIAAAVQAARYQAAMGATIDEILTSLRASGFTIGQCHIALVRAGLCEPSQAKATVLSSPPGPMSPRPTRCWSRRSWRTCAAPSDRFVKPPLTGGSWARSTVIH